MFGNSQRAYTSAGQWRKLILGLVLALVIGSMGPTSSAYAFQANTTELGFYMLANKERPGYICMGEFMHINVLVYRYKLVNGVSEAPETITGVTVDGWSNNPNIGQISPRKNTTIWASGIYPGAADFIFTAENYGQTTITFEAIVGTGWFGTTWGGDSKTVTTQLDVQVIPCKFKIEAISHWNNNVEGIYLATMDETEITANADGQYSGTANMNWAGTFMMDSCPKEYTIPTGRVNLSGELSDTGQLSATLTYQAVPVTFNGACGNLSGWDNFEVSQDPLNFSVPASGGTFRLPQVLMGSAEMGIFDGSVVMIVTPVEDKAVAFVTGEHLAGWDNFLSLFGVLLALR